MKFIDKIGELAVWLVAIVITVYVAIIVLPHIYFFAKTILN